MINVYIVSGFLGAGKTTFIKKLLNEHKFEKVMLLENEFGEVGVDSAFFDSSLKMLEINNGCICCSLQGDFKEALKEIEDMGITDLIIEPSGVGKLSDIIDVVKKDDDYRIISHICIVDVKTAMKYHNNFKDYFDDQVKSANAIILSHVDVADEEKIALVKKMVKELNNDANIFDKKLTETKIADLFDIIVGGGEILPDFDHHDDCCCHDHHHDDDCCHKEHHHHDECCHHHHDDEDKCHHHDAEHDECCHHDEHHHHHHHDDDTFKNLTFRPEYVFEKEELEKALSQLDEDIIRAKGYVFGKEGTLYFNYVLNEYEVYYGEKRTDSLVVVIASNLNSAEIKEKFHG